MKIFAGTRQSRLNKSVLGADPLIHYYVEKLRICETFRTYVKSDARLAMPIEAGVCILLHNILTEPLPLYEIGQWLALRDPESLGLGHDDAALLNDDRLGRVLDAVAKSNRKTIFMRLALRMIKIFELDCGQIHPWPAAPRGAAGARAGKIPRPSSCVVAMRRGAASPKPRTDIAKIIGPISSNWC